MSFLASPETVPVYGLLEIPFNLKEVFSNPFDRDEIAVDGLFIDPSGRKIVVPAFWYKEYLCQESNNKEAGIPKKFIPGPVPAHWRIRFTPETEGIYSLRIRVSRKGKPGSSYPGGAPVNFTVTPDSSARGFVRVSPRDWYYLEFSNGQTAFFAGHNIYGFSGLEKRKALWKTMTAYGETITRFHMNAGVGCTHFASGKLGFMDLETAYRWDLDIAAAEKAGLYLILCLEQWNTFNRDAFPRKEWCVFDTVNLLSVKKGGPCREPVECFYLPEAQRFWKNLICYYIARWGYSPAIIQWTLLSEVNNIQGWRKPEGHEHILEWYREMSAYAQSLDMARRMVSVDLGSDGTDKQLWSIRTMDATHVHPYTDRLLKTICDSTDEREQYRKPYFISEGGIDWRPEGIQEQDTRGIHLHDFVWITFMRKCAAAGLSWWDGYIDRANLYGCHTGLARFVAGEDLAGYRLTKFFSRLSENLDVYGLEGPARSFYWFHDRRGEFCGAAAHSAHANLFLERPVHFRRAKLLTAEWWDTWKGTIIKRETVACDVTGIRIAVPEFMDNIALKLYAADRPC